MLGKKAKEVLTVLEESGLLKDIILIGSWCGHFYQIYFGKKNYSPNIQTLDIDFLVPRPNNIKGPKLDILLQELDFEKEITHSGWVRFVHPELRVEFLVPRLCNQSDEPRVISKINISAMPLRHLAVLTKHTILVNDGRLQVRLPHPFAYSLHKIFISSRRKDKVKASRDQEMAFRLLEVIKDFEDKSLCKAIVSSFTIKEMKVIKDCLQKKHPDLLFFL